MPERGRWGRAGVRLTREQATRSTWHAQRRDEAIKTIEAEVFQKWAAGMVVPHNITIALDLNDLYGPEVDAALGVREPAVDMWEAGKLYPTWFQLQALSELTGYPIQFFVTAHRSISVFDTSIVYHCKRGDLPTNQEIPVMRYPDDVVARCPGTGLRPPAPEGSA